MANNGTDKNAMLADAHVEIMRERIDRAVNCFERFVRDLAELRDKAGTRAFEAEYASNAIGDLGNVLSNARLELIVQHAAVIDKHRALAELRTELDIERGEGR